MKQRSADIQAVEKSIHDLDEMIQDLHMLTLSHVTSLAPIFKSFRISKTLSVIVLYFSFLPHFADQVGPSIGIYCQILSIKSTHNLFQGEMVDNIAKHVELSADYVERAKETIKEAKKLKRKARKVSLHFRSFITAIPCVEH